VALLAENTQTVHSRVVEQLRPDNPLASALYLAAPFSLTNPAGIAALNAEVTRQPAMVAYLNDIALVMIMALGSYIQLLLVRPPPLPTPKPAMPIWRRRLPRRDIADPNKSARSVVAPCAS
jgi:DHA2 family multidrug resistance protein